VADQLVHGREMGLEAIERGPHGPKLEQLLLHPRAKIDADGAQVALDLRRRFLESEVHGLLAATARGIDERAGERRLARPGSAAHEDAAPPVVPTATQEFVQRVEPARDALLARLVIEPDRGHRQDVDPPFIDEEGVLVRAVRRAAVLDDPNATSGDLIGDTVVEEDHAVRDVLLEAVAREGSVAAFRGDDGRELAVLEPPKEPAKLGPKDSVVIERAEERLERVDDDPFGADRVDAVSKPDEEPLEIGRASC